MTNADERTINKAICLLGDEHHAEREAARAALHAIFRNTRRLEARAHDSEGRLRSANSALDALEARERELKELDASGSRQLSESIFALQDENAALRTQLGRYERVAEIARRLFDDGAPTQYDDPRFRALLVQLRLALSEPSQGEADPITESMRHDFIESQGSPGVCVECGRVERYHLPEPSQGEPR